MNKILYTILTATALMTTSFAADAAATETNGAIDHTTEKTKHVTIALKKLIVQLEIYADSDSHQLTDPLTEALPDSIDVLFNRLASMGRKGAPLVINKIRYISPLHLVANGEFTLDQFKTLFEIAKSQGETVEAVNAGGMTLLYSAVMTYKKVNQNSIDIINWLLDNGARTKIYVEYGNTEYTPYSMALSMDTDHRLPIETIKRLSRGFTPEQVQEEVKKATDLIAYHKFKAYCKDHSKKSELNDLGWYLSYLRKKKVR